MDSSVSGKDEIWFLRVSYDVPHELYQNLVASIGSIEDHPPDWK